MAPSIFVVRIQQISCDVRTFTCRVENGGFSSFSAVNKLCFIIIVLNNKAIFPLNLVEYPLILANSAYGLLVKYQATFLAIRRIIV